MRAFFLTLIGFFSLCASASDFARPQFCRVVAVTQTNSLIVRFEDGVERQVVFANISIPYGDQPYAARANEILKAQLLGRQVNLREAGEPKGGAHYIPALVYIGKHNFNVDLVKRGHAWVNPLDDPHPVWNRLQAKAKSESIGLWATDSPQHPLDYAIDQQNRIAFERTFSDASASLIEDRIKHVLIGIRPLDVYVPIGCHHWTRFKQVHLTIFTTKASASAAGFTPRACDSSEWSSR